MALVALAEIRHTNDSFQSLCSLHRAFTVFLFIYYYYYYLHLRL